MTRFDSDPTSTVPARFAPWTHCEMCQHKLTPTERLRRTRVCEKCHTAISAELKWCRCARPVKIPMRLPDLDPTDPADPVIFSRCERCGRLT